VQEAPLRGLGWKVRRAAMDEWWQNSEVNVQDVICWESPRCTAENCAYDIVAYKVEGPVAATKPSDIRGANGRSNKMTALMDLAVDLHNRPR